MAAAKRVFFLVLLIGNIVPALAQDTIPVPQKDTIHPFFRDTVLAPVITNTPEGSYTFKPAFIISWSEKGQKAAAYFKAKFVKEKILAQQGLPGADIFLITGSKKEMGSDLFLIDVLSRQILITSASDEGFIRAIDKLRELLPAEVREGKIPLAGITIACAGIAGK